MVDLNIYGDDLVESGSTRQRVLERAMFFDHPQNAMHIFEGVFYVPSAHCLYDRDGHPIAASRLWRDRSNPRDVWPHSANPIMPPSNALEVLDPVIFLSVLFPHYGHFLLEGVARLWGIMASGEKSPKLLYSELCRGTYETLAYVRDFFKASALDGQFIFYEHPVFLKKVYVPEASFYLRWGAYSNHVDLPHKVAARVLGDRVNTPLNTQPVYLSRTRFKATVMANDRIVLNEVDFEAMLSLVGYRICHTEDMTLEEQIVLFNTYKYFVGTRGSAFHNLVFSLRGAQQSTFVLYEGEKPSFISDYYLVDRLSGVSGHYLGALVRPFRDLRDEVRSHLGNEWVIDGNLSMAWLRKLGLPAQAVVTPAAPRSDRLSGFLMAHFAGRGDITNGKDLIIGRRGSGTGIQGFAISVDTIPEGQLEYRAMLSNGAWTDWHHSGQYCGTRGRGEDLRGFSVRLSGHAARRYKLTSLGSFIGVSELSEASSGDDCVTKHMASLEAFQLICTPI